MQMFSRTFFITLTDGREVVIQFQTERLDLDTFKPQLEAILASPLADVTTYGPLPRGFLGRLDEISKLSLWVSHYDLNEVNILIDNSYEVTGLIDLELSTPRPIAVCLGRIHTLAGEYTKAEF
ncbi:hypothetical protein VTI28DRAFT_3201 [Corynascus sepedonium]